MWAVNASCNWAATTRQKPWSHHWLSLKIGLLCSGRCRKGIILSIIALKCQQGISTESKTHFFATILSWDISGLEYCLCSPGSVSLQGLRGFGDDMTEEWWKRSREWSNRLPKGDCKVLWARVNVTILGGWCAPAEYRAVIDWVLELDEASSRLV